MHPAERTEIPDMRALLIAAFAALSLMVAGDVHAQSRQDFVLTNRTGYTIEEVYVSPSRVTAWGNDVLGADTLENARQVTVRFNGSTTECSFDIKVVYDDKETAEFRGVDLCRVSKVTLFYNRSAGTTRFTVE